MLCGCGRTLGVFKVLVRINTIVCINKPHHVHHICLHEDGINYQIRVTDSIPRWTHSGKPGIPEGKQRVSLDELLMF